MSTAFILGPRGPLPMQCADVVSGLDGDTLDVTIAGDSGRVRVRVCAVNAWEMATYGADPQGDGLAATLEVRRIVAPHPHVHLSSRYPDSVTGGRLKRYVDVQLPETGEWVDLGLHLMRLGLVRMLAQAEEYDRNLQYAQAQRAAMAARAGMWATLGTGPAATLRLAVDWSGSESVTLRNAGTVAVDLTGYWLCDGMTRTKPGSAYEGRGYEFPAGTRVPAGQTLTVKVGPGSDSAPTKFWDVGSLYIFDNPTSVPTWVSDGVYLGNPAGEIVQATVYPDLSTAPQE